jgi:prepilin-type N-terminal cleavage/methylation domain-containing protein
MGRQLQNKPKGFTIVELMIATAVFSVVLLLVTVGIVQVTQVYYKGITEANTQNTARAIIETVSQAIQFSGGNVTLTPSPTSPDTTYSFCVGNQQFTYRLAWQVENHLDTNNKQTWHAMVQGSSTGSCGSTAPDLTQENISGRDLVGEHMRLSKMTVESLGQNMYRVSVKVVYGDSDLLNNPTGTNASCLGLHAGSAFCAASELSTTVVKRVQ